MIDKDEYPQTAELERRCVNICPACGTRRPEARRPAAPPRVERGVHARRDGAAVALAGPPAGGRPGRQQTEPGDGHERAVCWEKFCRYWQVEPHYVPMVPGGCTLRGAEAAAKCDENTIGVVAIMGSTWTAATSPSWRFSQPLTACRPRRAGTCRCTGRRVGASSPVPAPGPGVGLPGAAGRVDQHVRTQVRPGVSGRGLGLVADPGRPARGPHLQGQLPGRGDADVRAQLLPARRAGRRPVLQTSSGSGIPATSTCSRPARTSRSTCPVRSRDGPVRAAYEGGLPVFAFKLRNESHYSVFDLSSARMRGCRCRPTPFLTTDDTA